MVSISSLPRKIGIYAPFSRSEVTWQALFSSIYLDRKLSGDKSCCVSYATSDVPSDGLSEAWLEDVFMSREMPDSAFREWANKCDIMFWFAADLEKRKLCSNRINHYLFTDITNWDYDSMKFTQWCSGVIVPTLSLKSKMRMLVRSKDVHVVYPDLGFSIVPVRPIRETDRMRVIISLFGVRNLRYRLEVLQMISTLIDIRSDLHVTVLSNSEWCREEQELVDSLGFSRSGDIVFITKFSDWEFFRMLDRSDVFVDLNTKPVNCFMLYSAIQRGVTAAAYNIDPNTDVLASGEIGYTIATDKFQYGYGFETADPDVRQVFRDINQTVFNREWLERYKSRQTTSTIYGTELEKRRRLFTEMWGIVGKKTSKTSPVLAFADDFSSNSSATY